MRRLTLLLCLISLLHCTEEATTRGPAQTAAPAPDTTFAIRTGTVVLTNPDTTAVPFVNYNSPTLAHESGMLFLRPDTTVSFAADGELGIIIATLGKFEQLFRFREGDTVALGRTVKMINEREVPYPMARVLNREVNPYELNIDLHLFPQDVDPNFVALRLTYDERIDFPTLQQHLLTYYRTGRSNLDQLRDEGKLPPDAYQRQLNRLNLLIEQVMYKRGPAAALTEDSVYLDSLRVPRLKHVEDYDHRLVQLLVHRLPLPTLPGKYSWGKADSIIALVHQNPGKWTQPLVEDVIFDLLKGQYNRDPIRFTDEIDTYATLFADPETSLQPFRRRIALDLQDFTVDELRLDELAAPAVLAYDGSTTTVDSIFRNSPTRYLLLDLWATWCYACLRDAPAVAALVDSLDHLDLSLHKLSIDASEVDWRLHLARKEAPKEVPHYVIAQPRDNPFLVTHDISGVPRYLLVDREGRVLIDKLQGFHGNLPFLIASVRETLLSEQR